MINKLKNNTKIKLISLLSALVLWLYVMTVEDPVETRTFSDIPITITNVNMVEDRGLAIYPKEELFTDISINGNLSSLRMINRDNIYIYGRIEDPKEGSNRVYLQANLPERVNKYDIKPHYITVNLEKVVNEKRSIKLEVKGTPKVNIDTIDTNRKAINIKGPKSLVNEVTSLMASIDIDEKSQDFSTKLKLVPINSDGDEVKGVTLEENYVIATVKLLQQKIVPVKLILEGENSGDIENKCTVNPSEVTIEGKKEVIDSISSINTQPIKVEDLKESDYIEVPLELPKGVKLSDETVDIKIELDKNITTEILISKSSIKFINNEEGIDIDLSKIPDNIKVTIIHSNKGVDIEEDDIKLYVDLLKKESENNTYSLEYETNLNFKSINIDPEKVEI